MAKIKRNRIICCTLLAGLTLSLMALTGCVPFMFKCSDGEFAGLGRRLEAAAKHTNSVHFLLVHGMTDHCPGYGETFVTNIASRLHLSRNTPDPEPMLLPLPQANCTNILRNFSYSAGRTQMVVHELTWTPTVYSLKTNAFAEDRRLNGKRVWLNKKLKNDVVDNGFGDAILYMNPTFQTLMQRPIQQAIEYVVKTGSSNDDIILVASSLGSKMTFDAVGGLESKSADEFAGRTTDIIMLANQIPLLNLGTRRIVHGSIETQGGSFSNFLMRSQSNKVEHVRQRKGPTRSGITTNVIHVVAATDPNDLLSFPLRDRDIPPPHSADGTRIEVVGANIYSHNAWGIPWLFENPTPAHNAYDENRWLLNKLVKGFSSTKGCLPKAEPLQPPCPPLEIKHDVKKQRF